MRRLGCALLGASAMILGVVNFVPAILAAAAHSQHQPFSFIGWLALWALLFEVGALFLGRGILGARHFQPPYAYTN